MLPWLSLVPFRHQCQDMPLKPLSTLYRRSPLRSLPLPVSDSQAVVSLMSGAPSCRTAPPTHPSMPGSHPGPPLVSTWWSRRPCPVSLPTAYLLSLAGSTQSTVLSCGTGIWSHSTLLFYQRTLVASATADSCADVVLMTQQTVTYCWMSSARASATEKNSCACAKSTWRMHVGDGSSWTAWNESHFPQMTHTHCGSAGLDKLSAPLTAHPHQCTRKGTDPIDQIQRRPVHHSGPQHSPYLAPMAVDVAVPASATVAATAATRKVPVLHQSGCLSVQSQHPFAHLQHTGDHSMAFHYHTSVETEVPCNQSCLDRTPTHSSPCGH